MENPFIRLQMALGEDALDKLHRSHVAVFGIGGVGSYTAEALARAGIGAITLVDNDTVGVSNLNRQLCALHSTLGKFKAEAMAERIHDINPDCKVRAICRLYTEEDKLSFFDTDYSYIADCIDLVSCKLSLIMNARERNIPPSPPWARATSSTPASLPSLIFPKPRAVPWPGSCAGSCAIGA